MNRPRIDDQQFDEYTVTELSGTAESGYTVSADHTGFGIPPTKVPISIGSRVQVYGGFGSMIRGIVVDSETVYYRTREQQQWHQRGLAFTHQTEQIVKWLDKREENERRIAALPMPFRLRMERFRHLGGVKWAVDHEGYELFCLEQAIALAFDLRTSEEIQAFRELPSAEQQEKCPAFSDGHSGNTFGFSCVMAELLVRSGGVGAQEQHGALCPLVGCKDYHCFAVESELLPHDALELS